MRKVFALCLVILPCAISVSAGAASKVTTDPNVHGSTVGSPTDQTTADKQLARKIAYESGYTRLHTAADELTKLTGVQIRAGSSTKDWQIRDIPLVICVKDLPLGELLSAIADSTHTLLSSRTLDSGEKAYRFYRNKRLQDEIDGKLQAAQEKQYEQIEWAWDALLKLAKSPEAQAEAVKTYPDIGRGLIAAAELLASTGPDARDRVLSGEAITVDSRNSAQAAIIKEIFIGRWGALNSRKTQTPLPMPEPEAIAKAEFVIKLKDGGDSGYTDVWISTSTMRFGTVGYPYMFGLATSARQLEKLPTLHLSPRPKSEQVANQEFDHPSDPKLHALETDQDWAQPIFDTKVKMDAPKDKTYIAFADAVTALAKASGLNIVSEDFLSHNWNYKGQYDGLFGVETAPSMLLRKKAGAEWPTSSWFHDSDAKLLVGWAKTHGLWRKSHRNLVPESTILSLTNKLDTSGTELDDVLPILSLTQEQRDEWLLNNRDTMWLMVALWHDRPLWQLYNSLNADNKVLAKSEGGLPLAALDTTGTIAFLRDKIAQEQAQAVSETSKTGEEKPPLLDPVVLRTAVMRIKSVPATTQRVGDGAWHRALHHSYVMQIEYEKDGQKATLSTSDLGLSLPVYSSKRENELMSKLGQPRSP